MSEPPGPARSAVRLHTDLAAFRTHVVTCLLGDELVNGILLGTLDNLVAGRIVPSKPPLLVSLEQDGAVIGVALTTPPKSLLLTPLSQTAVRDLTEAVVAADPLLPGVFGSAKSADWFAESWSLRTGQTVRLEMDTRLFRLDQVQPPRLPEGRARVPGESDAVIVAEFVRRFAMESLGESGAEDYLAYVRKGIATRKYLVWEAGNRIVSMAAIARETPGGGGISTVYTPPEERGRGYASACVAELSRRLLAAGKSFCFLFTDLKNSTSNSIYPKIGYRAVTDFRHLRFD